MADTRTFTPQLHARFAALSGDHNPMHMDPVAARRTQAGAPVVHGIHTLLWLLDCIAARHPALPPATSLKALFRKIVYVDDVAEADVLQINDSALRARVLVGGVEVLTLTIGHVGAAAAQTPPLTAAGPVAPPPSAAELAIGQISGLNGRLRFATPAAAFTELFPHAVRYLGEQRVAGLACASCLVGMVVPGLYSLFGGLDLAVQETAAADVLEYAVASVDERFRLVRVAVQGAGLAGTLNCVSRPQPVAQPGMAAIATRVARNEFAGVTALVAGGSRGLGEVTAKLIAAGGGRVIITYRRGQADAVAVAGEIAGWGGACDVLPYDATQGAAAQLTALTALPTHIYYFATPTIFRRKGGIFDAQRFEEFTAYYLTGFFDLVQACARLNPAGVTAFYPSTVYIDRRPAELSEYAMSKAAGEVLCADMQTYLRGVRVLVQRLPRLSTDQTGSLLPGDSADPVEVMLPVVRQMHNLGLVKV